MLDKVSVILPVYNGEQYLCEAIESILGQSYSNIELIVIDDGSSDGSWSIIENYAKNDSRMSIKKRENRGLVSTLNELISMCTGMYIARMDADDIAHRSRIEVQVQHLTAHKDVAVVGTGYQYIDNDGEILGKRRVVSEHDWVRASILFGNPIAHPTVMFNKVICGSALSYDPYYEHAEDFELWCRLMLTHELKIENIKTCLLSYRVHDGSVSSTQSSKQKSSAIKALESSPFGLKLCDLGGSARESYNCPLAFSTIIKLFNTNMNTKSFNMKTLLLRAIFAWLLGKIRKKTMRS